MISEYIYYDETKKNGVVLNEEEEVIQARRKGEYESLHFSGLKEPRQIFQSPFRSNKKLGSWLACLRMMKPKVYSLY